MRRLRTTACLVLLSATVGAAWRVGWHKGAAPLPEGRAKADPRAAALPRPLHSPRIVIRKSRRELALYSGDRLVKTCRVGLGFAPEGDKQREGDGRTPEGDYTVCVKNPESRFYLSLGLNYPNDRDAARGLAAGLISREQHDAIVAAIGRGERPPWDTPLGGEIFLHGGGAGRDWTLGCIALANADIRELFHALPVGTPVTIRP